MTISSRRHSWGVIRPATQRLVRVLHAHQIGSLEWKGVLIVDTLDGPQEMLMVSESGVYKLAFSSRKEGSERFTG
jgi:prophage antirepressor-like protein